MRKRCTWEELTTENEYEPSSFTRIQVDALNKELSKKLLKQLSGLLADRGYRLKNSTFKCDTGTALHLITVQKSSSNTAEMLKFTINVGIYLKELAIRLEDPLTVETAYEGHWERRIWDPSDPSADKWWTLHTEDDLGKAIEEIWAILCEKTLPKMDEMSSAEALCNLWQEVWRPGNHILKVYMKALCGQDDHSSLIPVDYTLKKYVRKPRKSAPGSVTYQNEKTIYVGGINDRE